LHALGELSTAIYENNFDKGLFLLMLNKLLLQAGPAVEETLNYVASWANDKRHPDRFKEQLFVLISVLRKFKTHPPEDADIAFVEENPYIIARKLSQWSHDVDVVKSYLMDAPRSRFNNVRQYIMQVNETGE